MPHRCTGCNTLFPDARYLKDGCPVCGCGKFIYEKGKGRKETRTEPDSKPLEPETPRKISDDKNTDVKKEISKDTQESDSLESIRILEPGRYDLNLSRLIESDDRVVRLGSEDSYRLDLHSMIRQKRKK